MVFSSPIFLFAFLPCTLVTYYLAAYLFGKQTKNMVLLFASLFFYAWGEVFYVTIMLLSIGINYLIGRLIANAHLSQSNNLKSILLVGVCLNVLILISFKYTNFIADNISSVLATISIAPLSIAPVHLPLGISFFTFQAVSYIVDVYRKEVPAQPNVLNLALYIALFPQLIAGPIVRYRDVAQQILDRVHSSHLFFSGVQRFIIGLSKKMLLANPLGEIADNAFLLSGTDGLTMQLAWLGIIAYALQIYFDFSGYSDMAIGLGRMFGFKFLENFNYPYVSSSLREFWQRWHISLSSWFKDYVYIPLGGSRVSTPLIYRNLLIVFLLTGVWHGASWNFIFWGLFHGFFLTCEHMGFSRILNRIWRPFRHLYLLLIILVSWVFFRADNLGGALVYLSAMADISNWSTSAFYFAQVLSSESLFILLVALMASMPLPMLFDKIKTRLIINNAVGAYGHFFVSYFGTVLLFGLFYVTCLKIAGSTYNPFIYFRF